MRILCGSCVRQVPEVLRAHLETLRNQKGDFTLDFAFVDDCDDIESQLLLPGHVMMAEPKPDDARYAVTEKTHDWSEPLFHWLGRQKQRLIDHAKEHRYDALWLVDSDLLCAPDTLASLLETKKEVVSAVFWTKWQPDAPPLPQVWMAHPYGLAGRGIAEHEFLERLASRKLQRVAGLGACTLIRSNVFDKVAYWPAVEGLPSGGMWQGEDRHFCVRAERNHVELWADAWPDVWHCYRPSDRENIEKMRKVVGRQIVEFKGFGSLSDKFEVVGTPRPKIGELVSALIQPLEEPTIHGHTEHVRGRLGQLKLLPDVEDALLSMRVGESRIVKARFPIYYEIAAYRGQTRLLRVKLVGAKPFALAPTLEGEVAANRVGSIVEAFTEAA